MSKRHAQKGSSTVSPETERNVMGTQVGLGAVVPRGGFGVNVTVGGKAFDCPPGYIRLPKIEANAAKHGFQTIICAKGCYSDDKELHMSDVASFVAHVGDKTFYDNEPALAYAKQTGLPAHFILTCKAKIQWGGPTFSPPKIQIIGYDVLGSCEPIELYVAKNVTMMIGSQKLGPGSVIDHSYWQAKMLISGTDLFAGGEIDVFGPKTTAAWDAVVAPGHSLVLLPTGQYGGAFPLGEGASLASYTTAQCASGGGGSTCPPGMYKLLGKCVKSAGGYALPGAPGSAPSGRGLGSVYGTPEVGVGAYGDNCVRVCDNGVPPVCSWFCLTAEGRISMAASVARTAQEALAHAHAHFARYRALGLGDPGFAQDVGLGAPNNLPTWPPCSNGEVRDFQGMCVPPGSIYPPCMPTTASPRGSTTVHVAVRKGADPLPDTTYAPGSFLPHHAWQAKLVDLGGGIQGWAAVVAAGHTVHIFSASLGSLYLQPGGHLNPYVTLFCGDSLRGGGQGVYGTGLGCPSDTQIQGNCPDGYYFCTHDNVCKRRPSSEAFG